MGHVRRWVVGQASDVKAWGSDSRAVSLTDTAKSNSQCRRDCSGQHWAQRVGATRSRMLEEAQWSHVSSRQAGLSPSSLLHNGESRLNTWLFRVGGLDVEQEDQQLCQESWWTGKGRKEKGGAREGLQGHRHGVM